MSEQVILLFNVKTEKEQQIRTLCRPAGIRIEMVRLQEYAQPIGALAGLPGMKKGTQSCVALGFFQEMMVFSGFEGMRLDLFLKQYREAGITAIDLKAVVTPINAHWSATRLYDELSKEHAAMHRGEK